MSSFVENILNLIRKHNLTFRTFAENVGISSSQLSKYASGNYEPTLKNALLIADYFGCSLDYLMGLDDVPNRFGELKNADVDKFFVRLDNLIKTNNTNINRISRNIYVSRNCIYHWFDVKIFPKINIIGKLATELNTTIEYLIGRTDSNGSDL